ncbi:DUF998 domain-containing protein [Kribbella sp. NPDC054772]
MEKIAARCGAVNWIVGVGQFFVVMVVVQLAWKTPYSWGSNNISDLGNVHCGHFNGRYVCSPLHPVMNVSFAAGGVLMILGTVLTHTAWPQTVAAWTVRLLLVATGAGWMVAGLSPADVNEDLHVLGGAFPIFAFGNLALLLTGFLRTGPLASIRRYGVGLGALGMSSMVLHFTHHGLGLGVGGMERVTAFALPLRLILAGQAVTRSMTSGPGS